MRWTKTMVYPKPGPAGVLLMILLFAATTPGLCRGEAAILRLTYGNASELLPLVEGLLSREGRAAVDTQSNSLVIVDDPEVIRRVESFLSTLDQPVPQARIRVRLVETESLKEGSFSTEGRISGSDWSASKGGRSEGLRIHTGDTTRRQDVRSEYYLQVASGKWAYVAVGKDVPFTLKWVDLGRRHGRVMETASIRRIETGLDVRPAIIGDRADVEIVPRISHEAPGTRSEVVRFASSSTRTTVPLRQWSEIGRADYRGNEVMDAILESGSSGRQGSISIMLMVEPVE